MYYKDYLGNIYEPGLEGQKSPVGPVKRLNKEPPGIVWEPAAVGGGWLQSSPVVPDESFRPWIDYIEARWPGSCTRETSTTFRVNVPWQHPSQDEDYPRTYVEVWLLCEGRNRPVLYINVESSNASGVDVQYSLVEGSPTSVYVDESPYNRMPLVAEATLHAVLSGLELPLDRTEHLRRAFAECEADAARIAQELCEVREFLAAHKVSL